MHESQDDELTAAERQALDALPRERQPSALLEERTVRALRERGLLRGRGSAWSRAPWRAAATAAAIALFAAGTAFGQWLGARQAADTLAIVQQTDAMAAALQVQYAGTAYLDALAALVATANQAEPAAARQAREVAFAVYRGAADELDRLVSADSTGTEGEVRHVLWF